MFNLFRQSKPPQVSAHFPYLDRSLYPLDWQRSLIDSPNDLLIQSLQDSVVSASHSQKEFSHILQKNPIYQDWINFTVFGRYIQLSFSAFYHQDEDTFNTDMPDILRNELMRHTQLLPKGQVLFYGGSIPSSVRQEKLIMTTLNPFKAILDTQQRQKNPLRKSFKAANKDHTTSHPIINLITVNSEQVKAFAIKHNKRTRERFRNEIMVLDFTRFVLTKEEYCNNLTQSDLTYLIRYYDLG